MFENLELSLHHVGIAVASIEESAAFYIDHFGYAIESPIIHDPVQTAFVQFLRVPGDSPFLELVAPDSPESKLASAVRKGGGLNHMCYRVADIEAAMAKLNSIQMTVLCSPVAAVAFPGRRIAWLLGSDRVPVELVETGEPGKL